MLACFIIVAMIYSAFKKNIEHEYFLRYQSLGEIMANTFRQMEGSANLINENAARVLFGIEQNGGLPKNQNLNQLAKKLGIKAFYVTNKTGHFIRSTDLPLKLQTNSIFKYCEDYKLLISGNAGMYRTPIIPGFPYNIPMKLTMIPNHDRSLILESGIELEYIGKILHEAIKNDKNIEAIGFYTMTGFELGSISKSGEYHRGRTNDLLDSSKFTYSKVENGKSIFSIKIPSIDPYCCECIYKKVSGSDGRYYYILRMEVSLYPLLRKVNSIRDQLILTLSIVSILGVVLSLALAKKLVSRIEKINKTAAAIVDSNNLNLRVDIDGKSDEIAKLATTFNTMVEGLKISQDNLIETEKMKSIANLAAQVAHDIRSPLAAMDMTLTSISENVKNEDRLILRQAVQSVHDIANNLLASYRHSSTSLENTNDFKLTDDGNHARFILLSSIVEQMISQKRQEWMKRPCKIDCAIEPAAKFIWIYAIPNDIRRMLSNLFNNAYESLEKNREINVNLLKKDNFLQFQISDAGIGIPGDKINSVIKGVSLKHEGKGLGLSSAKSYMEQLGGHLSLFSEQGCGTHVSLIFPHSNQPSWFPGGIVLEGSSPIVVLDDDPSIHNLWRHRLMIKESRLLHFLSGNDLIEWRTCNPKEAEKAIYLMDYELRNDLYTGLELLERLDARSRAYLITSHAEEVYIQESVAVLGVWLIPKSLIGDIQLS